MLKLYSFTKHKIFLKTHSKSKKKAKNLSNQSVMLRCTHSLTFEKLVLISGVDGVISIELNID